MKTTDSNQILKKVNPYRVLIPIAIGLSIVVFLLYKDWNNINISYFSINSHVILLILLSFLMMVIRDVGYMLRLRIISEKELSWKKIFNIIMLWEFASSISPSAVGGTTVATYFIYKEGTNLGKSTALVLTTAFLDELYFLLFFPFVVFLVGPSLLFSSPSGYGTNYLYFAFIGYGLKFIFISFVGYGLFFRPVTFKNILIYLFKLRFLKRWQAKAEQVGNDIITASKELKGKSLIFWVKAYLASIISWTARYWVVNFLILALYAGTTPGSFSSLSFLEHFEIFARQLVMWVMMLVFPSPGASGFAEAIFSDYLAMFIPIGFVAILTISWRLVSYYPYLFIGVIILPTWIKRTHSHQTKEDKKVSTTSFIES